MPENKESFNIAETGVENYSPDRVKIEVITELPELKGKLKGFSWPLELQGKGLSNEHDKTMIVRFPKGDIFLSFATAIHELGHLRQEELEPSLKKKVQTHENLLAQESDAWNRGWERMRKSGPDMLKSLQERFKNYRLRGELRRFDSFKDLYQWIGENLLRMVSAQGVLFDGAGEAKQKASEEQFDALADELEKMDIREFLKEYEGARVGETVNEEEMKQLIKQVVEDVIKEK